MRTVRTEIVVDQGWLSYFLERGKVSGDPTVNPSWFEAIDVTRHDLGNIVDILDQIYQQDLEQQ